jgi:hypothetical protein
MFFRFGVWVVVGRGYPRLAKGAGLKIRQSLVRDPVAQAFVGSSPTPRTILEPAKYAEYSDWLRAKGNNSSTISSKTKILNRIGKLVNLWDKDEFDRLILNSPWSNGFKNNVMMPTLIGADGRASDMLGGSLELMRGYPTFRVRVTLILLYMLQVRNWLHFFNCLRRVDSDQ